MVASGFKVQGFKWIYTGNVGQMLSSGNFDKKIWSMGSEPSEDYNEFPNNFPYLQHLTIATLHGNLWKRFFEKFFLCKKSSYGRKLYINILSYSYIIIFFIEFYISFYNTM